PPPDIKPDTEPSDVNLNHDLSPPLGSAINAAMVTRFDWALLLPRSGYPTNVNVSSRITSFESPNSTNGRIGKLDVSIKRPSKSRSIRSKAKSRPKST